jgi:hypothetical protein
MPFQCFLCPLSPKSPRTTVAPPIEAENSHNVSTACGNNILLSLPIRVGTVTASSTNAEGAEENWPPLVCGISAYHKRSVGEEDFSYISYLLFSISYGDYLNTTPVVKHFDYASF